MNKKEKGWLLAVFDAILEDGDLETIGCFLKKNPKIMEIFENEAEKAEIQTVDIMEYIRKQENEKPSLLTAKQIQIET